MPVHRHRAIDAAAILDFVDPVEALPVQRPPDLTRPQLVLAYKWLELAAIQGHPEAAEQRDAVGDFLTPEQLAGARNLLEQWIKTYTQ